PQGAGRARGPGNLARRDSRASVGRRAAPVDPNDRQLHRAPPQTVRARPRAAAILPYRSRRRLSLLTEGRRTRMTGLLLRTFLGEPTERRPLWVMRQAGRYLPEYRALRARHRFEELAGDPTLAAEVTLQPLARWPLDAAIIFADLMSPVGSLGLGVRFEPG